MHIDRIAIIAMIVGSALGGQSQSIVGRWALVSLMRAGEDRTNAGSISGVRYYTFSEDGTFRITRGDAVLETGTWSQDTTVSPNHFDHVANVDGRPGRYVAGIFDISGDTLRIAFLPPSPQRRRPTQFRSVPEDGSWLLVYHRRSPGH